jgi:hypothetical protein
LPGTPGSARAAGELSEQPMSAILVIGIFLVVILAFNKFEFGRFD